MRLSRFAVLLLVVMLLSTNLVAEMTYRIAPAMDIHNGKTSYRYDAIGSGSELIFPLDFATYGFDAGVSWVKEGKRFISADLRVRNSISDPGGKFTDRDWLYQWPGLETNYSYTESKVKGNFSDFELEFQLHKKLSEYLELGLLLGFSKSKISQTARGFSGAIMLIDTVNNIPVLVNIEATGDVLTYEITHTYPYAGIIPEITLGTKTKLILKGAYSPFVNFDDVDDHLLRFFTVKSNGKGWGLFISSKLHYEFGEVVKKKKPFVDISFDYKWMQADLDALVKFYADSPGGFMAGDTFKDDSHLLRSRLYSIGLNFGFLF